MMPHEGEPAPELDLPDPSGRRWTLADLAGRHVVLYFYPHDFTPNCTREACGFRDDYAEIRARGAEVLGVSKDPPERHAKFAQRHRLPFRLLSDEDGAAAKRYGVRSYLGILPGRETFVIGPDGRILRRFRSQLRPGAHVKQVLDALPAAPAQRA